MARNVLIALAKGCSVDDGLTFAEALGLKGGVAGASGSFMARVEVEAPLDVPVDFLNLVKLTVSCVGGFKTDENFAAPSPNGLKDVALFEAVLDFTEAFPKLLKP